MTRFGIVLLSISPLLLACDESPGDGRHTPERQATLTQARPIPPGAVPRGSTESLAVLAPPGPPPTITMLRQGREGYEVFCTPCHGRVGHGDGPVTHSGFPNPPSFHQGRLRDIEPVRIVAAVSEGAGKMPPLAEHIPPAERWAIAYYVKALQLSKPAPEAPSSREPHGASRP
jgi:mono/diheme cytochrome c family protein